MGRCRQASTGGLYCAYSQNAHQTSVNPRGLPEAEEDRRLGCLEGALTCHSSRRSIVKCQGGAWHNDQKCDEHCAQPDDEKMAPFCVDGTKASRSVTDGAATESLGVPDYGSCDRNQVGRSSCRDDRSSILFCTVDRRLVKKEDCGKGHCRISRHSGIAICGREGGGGLEQRSVADVVSITDLSATENDEDVSTDQTTQGLALSLAVMAIDDEHDSGTNDRKICTPGHKQCALTWNRKSVIKVCLSHGKALQQIKTCGKKGCCIEDLVSGTASCTCSQARSTTENEENGENEQSMEVSASDQGRPDNCTPGTYRCALTMDRQHSVIQVCALTNNWVRSVICGDPRCCHDSPVFGSSYCMY
ncbi:hypothetical protein BDV95DRAFT_569313 [Massariosphaeria phaeospora]|uniref:Uncharacterized protein n=1 Tax=Massariosphaeria phaeospora TaxID=100035 RepID=A0A7C8MCK7_9PLEO|nr:hypothetical protein BDV95DRAFT_569313 [Massariosphaeria phaeospora]